VIEITFGGEGKRAGSRERPSWGIDRETALRVPGRKNLPDSRTKKNRGLVPNLLQAKILSANVRKDLNRGKKERPNLSSRKKGQRWGSAKKV